MHTTDSRVAPRGASELVLEGWGGCRVFSMPGPHVTVEVALVVVGLALLPHSRRWAPPARHAVLLLLRLGLLLLLLRLRRWCLGLWRLQLQGKCPSVGLLAAVAADAPVGRHLLPGAHHPGRQLAAAGWALRNGRRVDVAEYARKVHQFCLSARFGARDLPVSLLADAALGHAD